MPNLSSPPVLPRRYRRHGMLLQLAAFEAVVRLGSVNEAADSLCVAQSTLSGHLRKLGDTLDVALFELHGKRLMPTAAAWALLQGTLEAFAALDRCERRLSLLRQANRGSVDGAPRRVSRVGAGGAFASLAAQAA